MTARVCAVGEVAVDDEVIHIADPTRRRGRVVEVRQHGVLVDWGVSPHGVPLRSWHPRGFLARAEAQS